MLHKWWTVLIALVLVAGGCGDDGESADPVADGDEEVALDGDDETEPDPVEESDEDAADESDANDEAATDPDGGEETDASEPREGDDEQVAPDGSDGEDGEDTDPPDGGDDGAIVSLGDCVMETLGLGAVAPDGLECRVLDTPIPGFDGFTMFAEGDVFTITFASRTPIRPCELPGFCENPTPIDVPGFSDAVAYDTLGLGNIFGASDDYDVDLVVSRTSGPLTDDDLTAVRAAAESFGPV